MRAGRGLDQLRGDAHSIGGLAHATLQHIAHAELASDLLHIDAAALISEAQIAGDHEEPADPAQCCDDLLDHTVSEIFLLRITAHIGEGQHRNRWLVRQRQSPCWLLGGFLRADTVYAQRPDDIFEALLAEVIEFGIDLAAHLPEGVF